ncbi:Condensin complex component, non-smc subunit [Balamuthia mandrillaris]
MEETLAVIFGECQRTLAVHKRYCRQLRKLWAEADDKEAFLQHFSAMLHPVLLVFKREPAAERVCQFVILFVVSVLQKESPKQGWALLEYLLRLHDVKDKAVRFRVCFLAAGIVNNMDEEAEIEETLWETLSQAMLQRAMDKVPVIRATAVSALSRLQNPLDADDPVTKQYLKLLSTDSSKDVRKAVLACIGLSRITLGAVLRRTRDVKPDVRKLAYQTLTNKLGMKSLSIEQRNTLVTTGLEDREEEVRAACEDMVCAWFKGADGGHPLKLLEGFGVEQFSSVAAEKVVRCLLRRNMLPLTEAPTRPTTEEAGTTETKPESWFALPDLQRDMTAERALLWRITCEHCKRTKQLNVLEDLLPDLAKFCSLLARAHEQEQEFKITQLLLLAPLFDFSDEAGRRALSALLREMLAAQCTPNNCVSPILLLLHLLCQPDEDEYTRIVFEVLSDVRDPLEELHSEELDQARKEAEQRYEELIDRIDELNDQISRMKKKRNGSIEDLQQELAQLQVEADGLENEQLLFENMEDSVYFRLLHITEALLQRTPKDLRDGSIAGLFQSVIFPGMQYSLPEVRELAVRCLGLYCMLDENAAKTHLQLFLKVVQHDEPNVVKSALEVLFDFILLFRWTFSDQQAEQTLAKGEEEKEQPTNVTTEQLLREVMFCLQGFITVEDSNKERTSSTLRRVATEGFCKLLLREGVLPSNYHSVILSQLVLLLFLDTASSSSRTDAVSKGEVESKEQEEETTWKQCLSAFFPAYAFSSSLRQNRMEKSFLPTIRALFRASPSSPLSVIPIVSVCQFLVHLTDSSRCSSSTASSALLHERLGVTILQEILANPTGAEGKLLPKVLLSLNVASPKAKTSQTREEVDEEEAQEQLPSHSLLWMHTLVERVKKAITDKNALRSLGKFETMLNDTIYDGFVLEDAIMDELEQELEAQMASWEAERFSNPMTTNGKRATMTNKKQMTKKQGEGVSRKLRSKATHIVEEEDEEESEYSDGGWCSDEADEDSEEETRNARTVPSRMQKSKKLQPQKGEETEKEQEQEEEQEQEQETEAEELEKEDEQAEVEEEEEKEQEDEDAATDEDEYEEGIEQRPARGKRGLARNINKQHRKSDTEDEEDDEWQEEGEEEEEMIKEPIKKPKRVAAKRNAQRKAREKNIIETQPEPKKVDAVKVKKMAQVSDEITQLLNDSDEESNEEEKGEHHKISVATSSNTTIKKEEKNKKQVPVRRSASSQSDNSIKEKDKLSQNEKKRITATKPTQRQKKPSLSPSYSSPSTKEEKHGQKAATKKKHDPIAKTTTKKSSTASLRPSRAEVSPKQSTAATKQSTTSKPSSSGKSTRATAPVSRPPTKTTKRTSNNNKEAKSVVAKVPSKSTSNENALPNQSSSVSTATKKQIPSSSSATSSTSKMKPKLSSTTSTVTTAKTKKSKEEEIARVSSEIEQLLLDDEQD